MNYSFIIPTYNRADILKQNIDVIRRLEYNPDPYEVIIVDDGSADGTKELERVSGQIRYKYVDRRGAPAARNAGAKLAKGKILIFIDDDCFPAPDYLIQQDLFWNNVNNSKLGILCGANKGVSGAFFGKIRDYFDSYGINEGFVTKACSSSLSIRKELFYRCGGFNPLLTGAEDVDLSIRIKRAGYNVYYCSKIITYHYHAKHTFRALTKRAWCWALEGEIDLVFRYTDELCPIRGFFDKTYNGFIKKLKVKIFFRYILFYCFLGVLHAILSACRLHFNNSKKLGFKIQYLPFTLTIHLTYELAFLYYLMRCRRRRFWYLRNKFNNSIFSPFNLLFSITSACNYSCEHCFYYKKLNSGRDLSFDALLHIIKKFKKIDELSVTGGEPFLRKDLVKILEAFYINCHPVEINIPTNGYFKERIINATGQLLEKLPLCQINVFLSFHGLEKTHDLITNMPGSFARTLETGKALRKEFGGQEHLYLSSLVCVHSKNVHDIEILIEYIQKELPGININFFPVRGELRTSDIRPLDTKQLKRLCRFRNILKINTGSRHSFRNTLMDIFHEVLELGYIYNIDSGRQFVGCFAATGVSKLEENGMWRPCEMSEECFDLTSAEFDNKRLQKIVRNIRMQRCSCTHDCFFKPALESNPSHNIKSHIIALPRYLYHAINDGHGKIT